MADWRDRAQIQDDVVFFRYVTPGIEKNAAEVYIWDLDKTYLDTTIDSLPALLATALERAFTKRNVPGTSTLLQVLSQDWKKKYSQMRFPLYFISASPPQMEERIGEKFLLDEIRPFGCFYKDNLANLRPSRFWRLTKQVGYKVQALLQLRTQLKEDVRQVCWGDDSESDAVIYNLYSDICARRLGPQDLRSILRHLNVTAEQIDTILRLQSEVPEQDPVDKIYINLAIDTDPDYYLKFGRRTLPTYNTFQVALDLLQDGRIQSESVHNIAQDMIFNYRFTPEELQRSLNDLVRRKVIGDRCLKEFANLGVERGLFPQSFIDSLHPAAEAKVINGRIYELEGHFEPWVPERIDYIHDYR
ncbi:MAG: phosphatase domain-containing protein [Pseudobdellovibrionaceae bacterium]